MSKKPFNQFSYSVVDLDMLQDLTVELRDNYIPLDGKLESPHRDSVEENKEQRTSLTLPKSNHRRVQSHVVTKEDEFVDDFLAEAYQQQIVYENISHEYSDFFNNMFDQEEMKDTRQAFTVGP